MSKFVVVVFSDEKKAYEGLHALKELHAEGSITLYSNAVVQRADNGRVSVKERQSDLPVGVGVGALVGGLVGLLGGPVGVAAGIGFGTILGVSRDLFNLGVSDEFVAVVSDELSPGRTALVAEISEEWVTPLDVRMEGLGGKVLREPRDDFIDQVLPRRIEESSVELARRKAELAAASPDKVERMKKAVSNAERNLRAAMERASSRAKRCHDEAEAKIRALQDQAKKVHADAKARIEERIEAVRVDEKRRVDKLEKAWKLTREAMRP